MYVLPTSDLAMSRGRRDDTTCWACPARQSYSAPTKDVGSGLAKIKKWRDPKAKHVCTVCSCDASNMEARVKVHEDYLEIKGTRNTI